MHLSMLDMVNRHAEARKALVHQLAVVEATPESRLFPGEPKFRIVIDGQLQDESIAALLRPVLGRELRARIAEIDRDLAELGVEA